MTDLEKKLNKIYNYADLIHSENLLILSIIGSLLREADKQEIHKCIKTYIQMLRLHNNTSKMWFLKYILFMNVMNK